MTMCCWMSMTHWPHGSRALKPLALTAIDFRTTALAATATQAPLAPNAGAARQRAMGCGKQHPYPCHAKAQLRDGVWTPGQDNTNARWRVVGSQPQLPAMDVVGWVNKAMRLTSVTGRILRVDGTMVVFAVDNAEVEVDAANIDKARLVPDWAALGLAKEKPGGKGKKAPRSVH